MHRIELVFANPFLHLHPVSDKGAVIKSVLSVRRFVCNLSVEPTDFWRCFRTCMEHMSRVMARAIADGNAVGLTSILDRRQFV